MKRSISYGEERIGFSIRFLHRTTKRIAIHVHPDGSVTVDAPEGMDAGEVVAAVRRRVRWIWQRLRACREQNRHVLPREYVSGESHFYLGKRHMLKVIVDSTEPEGVKLLRGRLEIRTRSKNATSIRTLLDAWYRRHAKDVFARRIADCAAKTPWLKAIPGFRMLTMRTQWEAVRPRANSS